MYEMEGPCPASPRRLASCLVFATRRPPGPGTRARAGLPAPPAFPASPRVVPVSSEKAFLLSPQAPRKTLRPAISYFSAIHEGIHREQAVIRIHCGYPRLYSLRFGSKVSPIQDHRRYPRDPDLARPRSSRFPRAGVSQRRCRGGGQRAAPAARQRGGRTTLRPTGPGWLGRPDGRGRRGPDAGGGGACHRRGAGQGRAVVPPRQDGKTFRRGYRGAPEPRGGEDEGAGTDEAQGSRSGTSVPSG